MTQRNKVSGNDETSDEFLENLKWLLGEISPGLGGLLTGLITPKIYELLPENDKKKWKETFPVHHGEGGLALAIGSVIGRLLLELVPENNEYVKIAKKLCEAFIGFGVGLTLEDIKDFNEWFKGIR